MRRVSPPFGFRAWPGVNSLLREAARKQARSVNSELNLLVIEGFRQRGVDVSKVSFPKGRQSS